MAEIIVLEPLLKDYGSQNSYTPKVDDLDLKHKAYQIDNSLLQLVYNAIYNVNEIVSKYNSFLADGINTKLVLKIGLTNLLDNFGLCK